MLRERHTHIDRRGGAQRTGHHGGVTKQVVRSQQNHLTASHIAAGLKGLGKRARFPMLRMIPDHQREENIGVDGDHHPRSWRDTSSSRARSWRFSRGTLTPPMRTQGSSTIFCAVPDSGKGARKLFRSRRGISARNPIQDRLRIFLLRSTNIKLLLVTFCFFNLIRLQQTPNLFRVWPRRLRSPFPLHQNPLCTPSCIRCSL